MVAVPCPVPWDSMIGDDRVRHCGACAKNVHNVSAMTSNEAEDFLKEHGFSECIRIHRRADGTLLTDNCPGGLRKIRDGIYKSAGYVAAIIASIGLMQPAKVEADDHNQGASNRQTHTGSSGKPVKVAHGKWIPNPGLGAAPAGYAGAETVHYYGPSGAAEQPHYAVKPAETKPSGFADAKALDLYHQAKQSEAQGKLMLSKIQ